MFIECPALFLSERYEMLKELDIDVSKSDFDSNQVLINTKNIATIFPSRDGSCWLQSLNGAILSSSATYGEIMGKVDGFLNTRGYMQKHLIRSITLDDSETPDFLKNIIDKGDVESNTPEDIAMGLKPEDILGVEEETVDFIEDPESMGKTHKFENIGDWSKIDDKDMIDLPMAFNIDKIQSLTATPKGLTHIEMVIRYLSTTSNIPYENIKEELKKSYK